MAQNDVLFEYLLRLGDTSLILGHRLSEICSWGPILEEDIAQTNLALDHLGQAQSLLKYAGEVEGKGRTEDDLAYRRSEREFRCLLLAQQPNTDFAWVTARNLLMDAWQVAVFNKLRNSADETLAGIAAKAIKEAQYHWRHSMDWTLRLGDGTTESHNRMQTAINELWPYTGELFESDRIDDLLSAAGVSPDPNQIKQEWFTSVETVLKEATLTHPGDVFMHTGSRKGIHTEYLGFMLAEMQYLPRAYPDATW
jgi:ring-1,2-phenylacetyl-CoA epoxidase subunit PaaC